MTPPGPALSQLRDHLHETRLLGSISSTLYFEQNTVMPARGAEWRGEQLGLLATQIHRRQSDAHYVELLEAAEAEVAGGSALAQQPVRPLPKVGGCPLGYYTSGNYCLSSPSNEREAIQKTGNTCPLGWFSSGSYCVKSR